MRKLLLLLSMMLVMSYGYSQTYTFTPAGAVGNTGPTQSDVNTAYAGTPLAGNVTVNGGIQYWVVPSTGTYRVTALGGQGYGSFGGRGASITGEVILTGGDTIKILVGQAAPIYSSPSYDHQFGGGGGSFVTLLDNTPLIIAGGGGGNHGTAYSSSNDAQITTSGAAGSVGSGLGTAGTNGMGGGTASSADGGGGLLGNGGGIAGGQAFVNGGLGGQDEGTGGFGGGGGTSSWNNYRAGGGGGYSGGGAATNGGTCCPVAGGGGSYNAGANPVNIAGVQTGDGQVIIEVLSSGASNDIGAISIDAPSNFCPGSQSVMATIQNFGINQITSATVNWSVNGATQTSYSFTGTLDTIGGTGTPTASINLGNYTFNAGTSYNVIVWTSLPNGVTDTVSMNDSVSDILNSGLLAPTNFSVYNVFTTTADFSWTPNPNAVNFNIIYGPAGFNPASTGTMHTATSSPTTISGLSSNTAYEAYIYADCGTGQAGVDTSGPISFRTTCVIATAPFTENFDGSNWTASGSNTGNAIDQCWTANPDMSQGSEPFKWIPRSTGPTSGNGPTMDATGGNFMYVEASGSSAGDIAYLTTPPIDVSNLTTPGLYFMEHRYSGGTIADMDVEVSSDGGATWATEYSITGDVQTSASAPWELRFVNLGTYTGDTIMVRFKQTGNGCCGDAAIDSVVVDEAPICPWPTAINVSGITNTSAEVNWNDPSGSSWTIEWGPCGFSQGTGGSQTTSSNPYTITGLAGNTCYDVYVRADCSAGGNGNSIWMGPISFTTRCNPITAPYSNNFDTDPVNEAPVCWDNYLVGASSQFSAASVYNFGTPQSGTQHVRFYNYNNDTTMLIGPEFSDLTAGDKMIEFYATTASSGTNHDLIIGTVSSYDNPQSFSAIDTINLSTTYTFYQIHLDAANGYNGTHDHIAFYHASSSTFITYYIDEFNYLPIPSCVGSLISTLGMNGISDVSGTAVWSGGQGDITKIEWGSVGFAPGSGASVGSATVAGTVNTYFLSGLTPQTSYEYYIQDSCNASGPGNWIGPYAFTTLCTVTNMPYYESFDFWPLACWQNDLGSEAWADQPGTGSDHYAMADFWNTSVGDYVLTSRPIAITQDAQIRFDWSHLYSTSYPNDQLLVLVQNISKGGQYDTVLDLIGSSFNDPTASNTAAGQFITEDIILDPNIYTGDTIVVTLWANSNFGPNLYVNNFYVENAPSCAQPASITINNIVDTAATINWANNPNATSYEVWIGPTGFYQGSQTTTGTKISTTNNSMLFDTLTSITCYEFVVRSICTAGDTSVWEGPYNFCTECSPYTAPYFTSFDNQTAGAGVRPNCWKAHLVGASNQFSAFEIYSFLNPRSAPNHVRFYNYNNTTSMGISPNFSDMDAGNKRVRFWAYTSTTAGPNELIVGTVSNTTNPSAFTALDTILLTNTYTEYIVDITTANGYNGTDNYVALLHGNNASFRTYLIDDFNYEVIPTCVRPTNFSNYQLGSNDASFKWNGASTTSGNYVIEYGSNPLGSAANTTMAVSNDSITLTGLTPNTSYCIWLKDVCTPGDTSLMVGPICFTTACVTFTAPYVENFENMSVGFTSGVDNCWTLENSGAYEWELRNTAQTTSTGTGPDRDNTLAPAIGGKFFNADVSYGVSGDSTVLTSPIIDISGLSNPELEYHLHRYGTIMADFYVDIYNGTNWIRGVHSYTNVAGFNTSPSDPYHDTIIDLSAYIGTTNFRVRFRSETNGCCAGDNALDDVRISDPVSCVSPSGLTSLPLSATSATVSWDTTGFGSTASFQVSYGAPGFTAGTGTQTTAISGNSFSLTGLTTTNLCLDAFVRAFCAAGDTSLWVGPISVCPQADPCDDMEAYNTAKIDGQSALLLGWAGNGGDGTISTNQASSGTKSLHIHDSGPAGFSDIVAVFENSYTTGIHNVEFDFYIPSGKGGYYNILHSYTGAANVWAIEVYLDMSGSATVQQGTNGSGTIGTYSFNMGAWNTVQHIIDLTNDTAWIMINGANANIGWQFSLGSTNMGDRFNAINFYSAANAGQTPDIYFDDLCVSPYVPSLGCADPTTLAASNITCDDAVLSWTSSTSMASSIIVYGPAGFNPVTGGTTTTASTGTVGVSNLAPNTAYDFYVVDICGNGDTSNVVGPASFTTLGGPITADFTPSYGPATAVNRIVSFDASASVGADSYSWDFGDGGVANTTTPNTAHSYSLNGSYQVCLTITGACGTDTVCDSVVVEGISLTENYLARSLSVYPNPTSNLLNISFDAHGSMEASLRLRDLSGKLIMEVNEKVSGSEFKRTLDISNLAKGVYMLEVVNGDNKAVRRITKD